MKTPFLLLLVLTSQLAFSQGIKMVSNEQIPIMESEGGCLPIMSPTGDYLIWPVMILKVLKNMT